MLRSTTVLVFVVSLCSVAAEQVAAQPRSRAVGIEQDREVQQGSARRRGDSRNRERGETAGRDQLANHALRSFDDAMLTDHPYGEGFDSESYDETVSELSDDQPVYSGYLIVNGQYLRRPYHIESADDGLIINGTPIPIAGTKPRGDGRSGRRSNLLGRIHYELDCDSLVILIDHQPPLVAEVGKTAFDLMTILATEQSPEKRREAIAPFIEGRMDPDVWADSAMAFEASPEFLTDLGKLKAFFDQAEIENQQSLHWVSISGSVGYYLSIFGMVAAILALGHLLSFRPQQEGDRWSDVDESSQALLMTRRCVLLIVVLSLLDLVWTVIAWNSGQMRELNPVGQHLITDPALLVGFKVTATLIGAGILLTLKRYRGAQLASWWMCLVLTVLTFRWLTFNSMFMS